jgi:hypothetical protein
MTAIRGQAARDHIGMLVSGLGLGISYIADTHLPRRRPGYASEAHGRVVLPYLFTLLLLAASEGGAEGATRRIVEYEPAAHDDVLGTLIQDLRNGMKVSDSTPTLVDVQVGRDAIDAFLTARLGRPARPFTR